MPTIKRQKPRKSEDGSHVRLPGFGVILFSLVFIYILIRVVAYMNDTDPVIFTVEQSTYDTDFTATGLAIRKETIINAASSGTPCYYVRDGEKVAKGANIYSLDSSGSLQVAMDSLETDGGSLLTSEDYSEISSQIKMFKTGFSASNFSDVYNFKTSMDNKLLEMYEELVLDKVTSGSTSLSMSSGKAPFSGLVTYYEDGYENVTVNDLSPELFDKTAYNKQTLKTEGQIVSGSPVCKLIDDEDWQIAISLTEEEYNKVTQNTYATYTINDSSRRIQTLYDTIEKDGSYYIVVSFNKYMAQYVNERFLDINFRFSESSGLKIPASSIIEKNAYMIPVDYLTGGSGDDQSHLTCIVNSETGKQSVKQITPVIYFSDEKFCYVDPDDIASDAVLVKNDSDETFSVATAAKYTMQGVLCVSKGIAEFRRVEIIVEGDDYSIVRQGLKYGISRYDRILLDGTSMNEGDSIY